VHAYAYRSGESRFADGRKRPFGAAPRVRRSGEGRWGAPRALLQPSRPLPQVTIDPLVPGLAREPVEIAPPPQPQRRRLPITQAAQGQPPLSGGQRWLHKAVATGR
jgi:hypothetical protein